MTWTRRRMLRPWYMPLMKARKGIMGGQLLMYRWRDTTLRSCLSDVCWLMVWYANIE